jgi:hypothetical protein
VDNNAYEIDTNFDIYFQNKTYRTFYVNTNCFVNFQSFSYVHSGMDKFTLPRIMIEANNNVAINLTIKATADNITVHYKGYNFNTSNSQYIEWYLTFYRVPY